MPLRPGDSTPDFDRIERHLQDEDESHRHAAQSVPEEPGLPDSHVFQMPMMVPHFSDGTTDVLQRGRNVPDESVSESTEPLFPRQTAPKEAAADDDRTIELTRSALPSADEATVAIPALAVAVPPGPVKAAPSTVVPNSPAPATAPAAPLSRSIGGLLLILLVSYASAVTIALVFLLMNRGETGPDRHQLEDLRDPADEEGTVRIYQRGAPMPPGHTLALGQSQRFGNILVEPLRVTLGPVAFLHYTQDQRKKQPPTPPVLKLWLKLTNVSTDQEIAPLDSLLVFKRELNLAGDHVSNTYLSRRGVAASGSVVFAYPAAQNSEWDMVDQELGQKLRPGESVETYIPSDSAGLETLEGELEWRFHLRKGYAPSGRGVTTLVEVTFQRSDVQPEAAGGKQAAGVGSSQVPQAIGRGAAEPRSEPAMDGSLVVCGPSAPLLDS